jgi:hypothetical protein
VAGRADREGGSIAEYVHDIPDDKTVLLIEPERPLL